MLPEIAKPLANITYKAELPRLSASLLRCFKMNTDNVDAIKLALNNVLNMSLQRVAYSAYTEACKQVEFPVDVMTGLVVQREARVRASQAAKWMADSTVLALQAMGAKEVISIQRADDAAVNELSLQFFGGTRYGWGQDKTARKVWNLSSAHDKDDTCDDNADEGPISINKAFQSGHFIPPSHINCSCTLGLVRIRKVR